MTRIFKSFLQVFIAIVFLFGAFGTVPTRPVEAASANLVISEVYGGGGNSGATYTNDFIEIINAGTTPISLNGLSLQYASATGTGNFGATATQITVLPNVTLAAGAYYLVKEAGGATGIALPTPDLDVTTSPINLSGSAGKVALVNSTTSLGCNGGSTICSPAQLALIIDLVGYGSANFYEGTAAAPTLTNSTSASRTKGASDTDNNAVDFTAGAPTPQNSVGLEANPSNGSIGVALDADITITFLETVTPSAGWYSLTCSISGSHSALVSPDGAGTVFTINPDSDFTYSEVCVLEINGSLVTPALASSPIIKFSTAYNSTDQCSDTYTPISAIQGSGNASPYAGFQVVTEGVVTADLQGTKQAVYIQDPTTDDDPLTSEGMLIHTGGSPITVALGARLRVTGTVTENNGLTEMTGPFPRMINCGDSGVTITPVELTLPFADLAYPERYENMLVTFSQPLIISEYFNFDRYGEIVLTSQRHMTPTALVEPGALAQAEALAYSLDRITLDDGGSTSNPDPAIHPDGTTFDMTHLFRGGDTVQNVTGVMDYAFSLYRIQPTAIATYTALNDRPAIPVITEGDLKIASFNVLNYFVTPDSDPAEDKDQSTDLCGPLGGQDCRGADADQPDEFTRQRNKILAALTAIDADIFGLMEIENEHSGGGDAVADLVEGLNAIAGPGTYDYVVTGAIGGDAIKQAILYKPASATPVGTYKLLTTAVDARFIDTLNRPALAQVFKDNKTGTQFAVAVNHLKSKGSDCNAVGDPDTGDGAGNCNLTRKAAAQALVDWLANPTYFPGVQKTLIIGDLNSYDKEDPIDMIKLGADDAPGTADDYMDMIFEKRGENAYGYVFDGQTGYLDHALANQQLAGDIVDVNFWHINADEPDLIDYDTSFKLPAQDALYAPDAYRSSDHDPVIVTLNLKAVLYLPIISK